MGPRTHDERQRALRITLEGGKVFERGRDVDVIPARHEDGRNLWERLVGTGGIDADLGPEIAERALLPLLEKIILIFRVPANRRAALGPWHLGEPVMQAFRSNGC